MILFTSIQSFSATKARKGGALSQLVPAAVGDKQATGERRRRSCKHSLSECKVDSECCPGYFCKKNLLSSECMSVKFRGRAA